MANGTTHSQGAAIPPDDANRKPTVADPDDPRLCQPAIAGGTYTTLVTGEQTAGRYCLTDMQVHASGAGEEVFMAVGDPVDSAAAPPPTLSGTEPIARVQRAKALSARFERNRWCDGLGGQGERARSQDRALNGRGGDTILGVIEGRAAGSRRRRKRWYNARDAQVFRARNVWRLRHCSG